MLKTLRWDQLDQEIPLYKIQDTRARQPVPAPLVTPCNSKTQSLYLTNLSPLPELTIWNVTPNPNAPHPQPPVKQSLEKTNFSQLQQ